MPSTTRRASYHAHKAHGVCVICTIRAPLAGDTRCPPCIFKVRRQGYIARHHPEQAPRLASLLGSYAAPATPLLAHCGAWHEVAEVPFTAHCCGAVVFEES